MPGAEEEDRKRLLRERRRLMKERTSLTNSIEGFPKLHGGGAPGARNGAPRLLGEVGACVMRCEAFDCVVAEGAPEMPA